ncbi:MAG: helix-turn-helix domain-containing protein [Verrucomicrobiales bacterium]
MGHLLAFTTYLRNRGAPVDKSLGQHGLPTLCEDPEGFVALPNAWAFFDAMAKGADPMLGWHVGHFVGEHNLNRNLLAKLDRAPSLAQALQRFIRLSSSEASHVHLGMMERGDDVLFFTRYPSMKGVPGYNASQSYQLGAILGVLRHFCGKRWAPKEIGIEHPTAPDAAEGVFPDCRILANQKAGYISIPRSSLHLTAQADNTAKDTVSLVLTDQFDRIDTLRALLKPYLPEGYLDRHLAASLAGSSVRTLNRRLAESGLTYRALIDELRFERAKDLLENTDEQVIDVAYAVGFEDTGNFTRMFRRVAGLTPIEFRRSLR